MKIVVKNLFQIKPLFHFYGVADKTVTLIFMKKKYKVFLGLSKLTVPEKLQKARGYVKAISGNPDFVKPVPDLAEVTSAIDDLEDGYNQAFALRQSASHATALYKQQMQVLDRLLSALGNYVEGVSFGDEIKIRSAGMDVKGTGTAVGIPAAPASLSASTGPLKGSLMLKWRRVRGAHAYTVQVTDNIADPASWQQVAVVTKSNFLAEGLSTGRQYWFQVSAAGSAGEGPWSDSATRVAP